MKRLDAIARFDVAARGQRALAVVLVLTAALVLTPSDALAKTVTKTYCISGTSDGVPWEFHIQTNGINLTGTLSGVLPPGAPAGDFAALFGSELAVALVNLGNWHVEYDPSGGKNCFTITAPYDFDLHVGPPGGPTTPVGTTPVPFNPLIYLMKAVDKDEMGRQIETNLGRKECLPFMYLPKYLEVTNPVTRLDGKLEVTFSVIQDAIDAGGLVGCPDSAALAEAQCLLDEAVSLASNRPPLAVDSLCGTLIKAFEKARCKTGKSLRCPGPPPGPSS